MSDPTERLEEEAARLAEQEEQQVRNTRIAVVIAKERISELERDLGYAMSALEEVRSFMGRRFTGGDPEVAGLSRRINSVLVPGLGRTTPSNRTMTLAEVEEARTLAWRSSGSSYREAWDEFARQLHRLMRIR